MSSVQIILNQQYLDLKAKNPRLSHRYFAKKLDISSGALSEILKGKRKISSKLAKKLAAKMNLDPLTLATFVGSLVDYDIDYLQLQDDQFRLISDWPHFAILNLVKSVHCQHRIPWFAEQLNLSLKVTEETIHRLLRMKMLVIEKKKYLRTNTNLKTSDDILNLSIQKSNLDDLEMFRDHLQTLDTQERDLTSLTMLVDPKKMAEFKKWIRKAQDQFALKFETTQSATPFRLTMALFPLKKPKS